MTERAGPNDEALPEGVRPASLADALVPLVVLVVLIGSSLALYGLDALDGPVQVALVLSCLVAALVGMKNGWRWPDIERATQQAFGSIASAVFILLAVGALIGTWNLSGTIPTLVYYGIQALSPSWYYLATAVICGVVALSIGSSWTTAGTIGVGPIVSVLGAYLAWSLMAAEVLFVAAKDDDMPRFLRKVNRHDAPVNALVISSLLVQVMLFVTMASENAFDFTLNMTSALTLIPFVLAAGYALRLAVTGESYESDATRRWPELVFAAIATIYTLFLLFAAGPRYMLVSFVIYAPGTVLFAMARREQRRKVFSASEAATFAVAAVLAVVGVVAIAAGWITI